MINYLKNQRVIRRWISALHKILRYQEEGLYEKIEKNKKLNRIIEVIEEYDDIIFEEE